MDDPIPAGFITLPEALRRLADFVSEAHLSAKSGFEDLFQAISEIQQPLHPVGEVAKAGLTASPFDPKVVPEAHPESAKNDFEDPLRAISEIQQPVHPIDEAAKVGLNAPPFNPKFVPESLLYWRKSTFALEKLRLALQKGALAAMVRDPGGSV